MIQRNSPSPTRPIPGNAGRRARSREAGFSLIEVMCAILILGVGIIGMVQGLTTALASSKESEWHTIAAHLAAGRVELLRADGFIIAGEDSGLCDELPNYQWRQTITATTPEGLFDITVTIENANTGRMLYELRTLLFDPPLLPSEKDAKDTRKSGRRNEGSRR